MPCPRLRWKWALASSLLKSSLAYVCRAFQWDLVVVGYPEVPVRGVIFQHQVNTKPVAHSNRLVPQPFIRDTAPSRGPEPEILVFPLITAGPRLFALSEVPMACLAVP